MKPFSIFKSDVCCNHDWRVSIEAEYNKNREEYCDKCGAYCKRDEHGQIEQYSLNYVHKYDEYLHRKDY